MSDLIEYNSRQIEQIRLGYEEGVDVTSYITPEFNCKQIMQIRLGLKDGIDVHEYATPTLDQSKMKVIRRQLTKEKKKRGERPASEEELLKEKARLLERLVEIKAKLNSFA